MKDLIAIQEHGTLVQAVDARELHAFLESKTKFTDWIKSRIEQYDFIEGQDYILISENSETRTGGTVTHKYVISLDMAKELSMVERNAKGKEARQYFIACEKALKKPMSEIELIIHSAQLLQKVQLEQSIQAQRLEQIEAKVEAFDCDYHYYTVLGWCNLINRKIDHKQAAAYGQCASYSRSHNIELSSIKDSRYGMVNAYRDDVLSIFLGAQM